MRIVIKLSKKEKYFYKKDKKENKTSKIEMKRAVFITIVFKT